MKRSSLARAAGAAFVVWGAVHLFPALSFFALSSFLFGFLALRLVNDDYAVVNVRNAIVCATTSLALSSLFLHYAASLLGFAPSSILAAFAAAAWALFLASPPSPPSISFPRPTPWRAALCLLCLGTLYAVYLPYACCFFPHLGKAIAYLPEVGDFKKNLAFTGALLSTGYPPANPFFALKTLTYYFGYHLPVAMLQALSGGALGLPTCWGIQILVTSLLFIGMAYLVSRSYLRCRCGVFIALLCMTVAYGLDILPLRHFGILDHHHIDRWNGTMGMLGELPLVNTFYSLFIWVPQHLFGAAVLLLIAVLTREMQEAPGASVRYRYALLAAVLFRAMVGYSLFIAGIGGMLLLAAGAAQLLIGVTRRGRLTPALLVILIPVCGGLLSLDQILAASGANALTPFYPHAWQLKIGRFWQYATVWFVAYPLEFGATYLLGIAGICWALRRKEFSFLPLFLYCSALIPFAAISVRKSALWNDWGMRCIIPAQISLSVFTGRFCCLFMERFRGIRARLCLLLPLLACLAIGLYGTVYEVRHRSRPLTMPCTLHEEFVWIRDHTPPDSFIVAPNEPLDYLASMLATISFRGSVSHIVPEYVNDSPFHAEIMRARDEIFAARDFQTAATLSGHLGADYLLLNRRGLDNLFKQAGFSAVPPSLFRVEYESDHLILYKVLKTDKGAIRPAPARRAPPSPAVEEAASPGGPATLQNPGFELVDKQGMPEGWSAKTFKPSVETRVEETPSREGKRCLRICSAEGGDGGVVQQVFLEAGRTYLLSGWAKAERLSTGGKGALVGLEGMEDKSLVWPAGTYDWTYREMKFRIENDQRHPLAVYIGGWGTSKGCAWFDDIRLTRER